MNQRLCTLLVALLAVLWSVPAAAGPLAAPQIRPDQHVYLLPPQGFEPPGLSAAGTADLERQLARSTFPFYVVIAQSIPGSGPPEELSTRAIDGLAADLGNQSAFDVATSSVFLWAPGLRQYRFIAGTRWKAELGFAREATASYSARFVPFMPRDPRGGILAVAQAVDAYLFDQTDPGRRAARAEVALQEAARRGEALRAQAEAAQQEAARRAEALRAEAEIAQEHAVRRARTLRELGLAALVALALLGLERRRRRVAALRRSFEETCAAWEEKVGNAYLRYVDFDADRDTVAKLGVTQGETAVVFREVSAAVDGICHAVRAMQAHLVKCRADAAGGSFLDPRPLAAARAAIEAPFPFDTGRINETELFGRETRILTVDPIAFARDLEAQFREAMARWQTLKAAAKLQLIEPKQAFPRRGYDDLLADLAMHGLDARWVSSRHPLATHGDLHASLEPLRRQDPVLYAARIAHLRETEASLRSEVDRLVAAVILARSRVPVELPEHTVVDADDDPSRTLDEARREDDRFAGILAGSTDVKEVEAQAGLVHGLFARAAAQAATIRHARAGAAGAVEGVRAEAARVRAAREQVAARIAASQAVHVSTVEATTACAHGGAQLDAGVAACSAARDSLADLRHLDAQRCAEQAGRDFQGAMEAFRGAYAECDRLDAAKAAFLAKVARAPQIFATAMAQLEAYGAAPRSGAYALPSYQADGPADYLALNREIEQQHALLQEEVDRERHAYEARLEAIRREEEAREAARQQAIAEVAQAAAAQAAAAQAEAAAQASASGGYGGGGDSSGGGYGGGSDSSGGGY